MIKTLIAAIVSALTAHFITKHFADKNVIALHRSYDRKNDKTFHDAYSSGWNDGYMHGYRRADLDNINDKLDE